MRGQPRKVLPVVEHISIYDRRVNRETPYNNATQDIHLQLLSTNAKTGWGINLPVAFTCDPSDVCREVCYACDGWFTKSSVQKKAIAVLQYFQDVPAVLAAKRLARECDTNRITYLRWDGSGDLIPETVAVINTLSSSRPDIVQVIYSRKPAMINALVAHPSVVINVSLDAASMDLPSRITRTDVRYTFLRHTPETPVPAWTAACHSRWSSP